MPTPYMREVYVHSPGTSAPALRSIPTHVGFTQEALIALDMMDGPSPRMWGLRPQKTLGLNHYTVHPHACGVYSGGDWPC